MVQDDIPDIQQSGRELPEDIVYGLGRIECPHGRMQPAIKQLLYCSGGFRMACPQVVAAQHAVPEFARIRRRKEIQHFTTSSMLYLSRADIIASGDLASFSSSNKSMGSRCAFFLPLGFA